MQLFPLNWGGEKTKQREKKNTYASHSHTQIPGDMDVLSCAMYTSSDIYGGLFDNNFMMKCVQVHWCTVGLTYNNWHLFENTAFFSVVLNCRKTLMFFLYVSFTAHRWTFR